MPEPNLSIILYSATPRNSKHSQRYTTRWKPQSSYGQSSFVCKVKAERARLQQQAVRHHEGSMVGGQETLCPMFQTSNLQNTCSFKKFTMLKRVSFASKQNLKVITRK
jgi:hypothetical protein